MISKILIAISSIAVALYSWEYAALRNDFTYSPSVTFNWIAAKCDAFWEACGRFVAWLSSFLTVFDFTDMLAAFERLFRPIVDILTSGFHFFIGYVSEMKLYEHPGLITVGSLILIGLIGYILYRFNLVPARLKAFFESYSKSGSLEQVIHETEESETDNSKTTRTLRKRNY